MDSIKWLVANQVLQLTLPENPSVESLSVMSQRVERTLNEQVNAIILIIDADAVQANYRTSDTLRALLPFTNHTQLESIITVSSNKLTRLVLLMAFSTALVPMIRFDNHQQVDEYLEKFDIPK